MRPVPRPGGSVLRAGRRLLDGPDRDPLVPVAPKAALARAVAHLLLGGGLGLVALSFLLGAVYPEPWDVVVFYAGFALLPFGALARFAANIAYPSRLPAPPP